MLLGNLWGDLLKPRDYSALSADMLAGIRLHQEIDAYTDAHPAVEEIMALLRPQQRKYTPVVADVLMDYIFSAHWHRFHDQPIEIYCEEKYKVVNTNLHLLPDRLHPRIHRMLGDHWLESCKNRSRMERTLIMLSHRAAFENNIPAALEVYDQYQAEMDGLFLRFFEDVRQMINPQNAG